MTDTPAPIVIPTPSRPARIAALHAAGLFLAEHLDLPMPSTVHMHAYDATWAQLTAIAQLHGAEIQYGTDSAWVRIPVALETLHGIEIEYIVFSRDVPQATPMDLPRRIGVVLPEGNPWDNVIPRCAEVWEGAQCVYRPGHGQPHFYDDDQTSPDHQHGRS